MPSEILLNVAVLELLFVCKFCIATHYLKSFIEFRCNRAEYAVSYRSFVFGETQRLTA